MLGVLLPNPASTSFRFRLLQFPPFMRQAYPDSLLPLVIYLASTVDGALSAACFSLLGLPSTRQIAALGVAFANCLTS